jgi:hypothetical protein
MKRLRYLSSVFAGSLLLGSLLSAQQAVVSTIPSTAVVPRLVNFSGKAIDQGKAVTGTVGITFSIYSEEAGGSPLWLETQNVQADNQGNYTAQLGAIKAEGLPQELFTSGEARWLGVRVNGGGEEQPRILLLSVPYALKAADAQTLGGLPVSAFMLAGPAVIASGSSSSASSPVADISGAAVSGTGTTDFLPLWTNNTGALGNSVLFQSGTGSTAKVGINTTTPIVTLDVNGAENVHGNLTMTASGTATAAAGKNSQPQDFVASVFNSSTSTAVPQRFQWQAEPSGNNTASASGMLSLLYATGTASPTETGLKINSKGQLTFVTGQGFPIASGGVTNSMLKNPSLTVKAGTDLTGGGSVALGGTTTLNLDTTKVPQLTGNNAFTNQNSIAVNTNCSGLACFPALSIVNAGNGNSSNDGGDGIDITTGDTSVALRINSNSMGMFATTGFVGALFDANDVGVYADSELDQSGLAALQATQFGTTQETYGVSSFSLSSGGIGTYSSAVTGSTTRNWCCLGIHPMGSWSDTGASEGVASLTTADNGWSQIAFNNSPFLPTMWIQNDDASGIVFHATGAGTGAGSCEIEGNGDLVCTGSKSAVVPVGSRQVALYAIEGPENWFEDAGSAELTNGTATVELEPTFGQTVNTALDYHVFLTPNGDCKGLYIAQKSTTSFIVRELGGGNSSIAFDYRIMAKRKGYENIRLADKTTLFQHVKAPTLKGLVTHHAPKPITPQDVQRERLKSAGLHHLQSARINTAKH